MQGIIVNDDHLLFTSPAPLGGVKASGITGSNRLLDDLHKVRTQDYTKEIPCMQEL
jgi:hypothetical protein